MKSKLIFVITLLLLTVSCGDSGNVKKYDEGLFGNNVQNPTVPTNMTITVVSETQINLTWTASDDDGGIAEYNLYRGGVYLKSTVKSSTTDIGLLPFTNYCYQVSAIDTAGNQSAQSAQVCAKTPDLTRPLQPTGLNATVISTTQIILTWTASSDNVGVTGYNVYRDGVLLKQVAGVSTSDTGLSQNANHCYEVTAVDATGNESFQSTQQCIMIDTIAPSVPAGLTAAAVSNTQINLSWSASTDNGQVAEYKVYRDGAFRTLVSAGTTATDKSLTRNFYYCYEVSALDARGNESTKSAQTCTTTNNDHIVPDTGQTGDYTATFGEDSDYSIYSPSYTDHGNGTVTDNVTGLVWQKQDDATPRTWDVAITYCSGNTAVLPGTGWRLPTDFELTTIVDYGRYSPAINPVFAGTQSSDYWSSTTYVGSTAYAWGVDFYVGYVDLYLSKSDYYYVRCVR